MAIKEFKTLILLRRDTAANYEVLADSFVPRKGEVVLVDTASDGLRAKVGDGISTYGLLYFTDEKLYEAIDNIVTRGYFLNGKFYTDSTYTVELVKNVESIYIDLNSRVIYQYDGSKYISVNDTLPTATDAIAGISKLYKTSGQNEDGSMTQKSITNGISSIKFNIDASNSECLVLDLPW